LFRDPDEWLTTMSEPVIASEPGERAGIDDSVARQPNARRSLTRPANIEHSRAAYRSLTAFGRWAGWGFVGLGVMSGAIPLAELVGNGPVDPVQWVSTGLRSLFAVVAFVMAGWGVSAFSKVTSAAILDHLEWVGRLSADLSCRVTEGLELLERIAESLEKRPESVVSPAAPTLDRVRSMAEIVRAAKAADWVEVENRFRDFEADFPDDPQLPGLKEELVRTRDNFIKMGLDQLGAAQAVSDADRVFEIYQTIAPSLDPDRRATLDPELAKWFLALIHRRLRTGKVQAEVVQLAARFADNFGATVEGASVRASLPTLRRSVGLCPRCAQPYIGVADACPNCLRRGTHAVSVPEPDAETSWTDLS
jgi:hypothetical protein